MATVTFNGYATDLSVGANYSGGSLPSAGDTLIIGEGNAIISGGVTALAATNLLAVEVSPQFVGSFGTASGSVDIQASGSGRYFRNNSPGAACYVCTTNGITLLTNSPDLPGAMYVGTGAGTIAAIVAQSGYWECGAGAVVTALTNTSPGGGANILIRDNATAITTLIAGTGSTTSYRAITTANVFGSPIGNCLVKVMEDEAVGTLNLGGTATYQHSSTGTITTFNGYGGTFTPQGSVSGFTITTANVYAACQFFTKWGGVQATISTLNTFGDVEQRVGSRSTGPGFGTGI